MLKRILVVLILSGCSADPVDTESTPSSSSILDDHARRIMQLRPVRASRLGLEAEFMGGAYTHKIGDYGPQGMQRWRDTVSEMQVELIELDDRDDREMDKLTLDVLADAYDRFAGANNIPYGYVTSSGRHRPYIINQIRHPLRWVTDSLVDYVAIESEADARAYISRLHGLSVLSDQVLAKFQQDLQAGWTAPIVLREKAEGWLRGFVAPSPPRHPPGLLLCDEIGQA